MNLTLETLLQKHKASFHNVAPFDKSRDTIIDFHFLNHQDKLNPELIVDTEKFSHWMDEMRMEQRALYAVGGYRENREMIYSRSKLFDNKDPRVIHLGVDIWGDVGTPVFAPMGGMVHSYAFNNRFGDYGVTIILQHQLETTVFYTLYGHLALADIENIRLGSFINRGYAFAHFGTAEENGSWPPHLHFQLIKDIGQYQGDYPGVCSVKEVEKYVSNCPDPLQMINF